MLDQGCAYSGLLNLFDLNVTPATTIIANFRAYFGTYHPKTSQLLALAKFLPIFEVPYSDAIPTMVNLVPNLPAEHPALLVFTAPLTVSHCAIFVNSFYNGKKYNFDLFWSDFNSGIAPYLGITDI